MRTFFMTLRGQKHAFLSIQCECHNGHQTPPTFVFISEMINILQ
jgi:hypothetical protein